MRIFAIIFIVCSIKANILQSAKNVSTRRPGKLEPRVVKGYNCTVEEYSHLAIIVDIYHSLVCGGSLIKSRWVLTAAHCCSALKYKPLNHFSVVVGQRVWNQTYEQKSMITDVHRHQNFSASTLVNDICLLKLQDEIQTNEKVRITKLATKDVFDDLLKNKEWTKVTVMGFGDQMRESSISSGYKVYNPHAQCATLYVAGPNGKCVIDHGPTFFCAADPKKRQRDACSGDSGGPLLCKGIQIGIISGGYGCELKGFPGYYTRVDIYKEFIDGFIADDFREHEIVKSSKPPRIARLSDIMYLVLLHIVY